MKFDTMMQHEGEFIVMLKKLSLHYIPLPDQATSCGHTDRPLTSAELWVEGFGSEGLKIMNYKRPKVKDVVS